MTREFTRRVEKDPRYSLRAYASALKIDIAALSQILSGKRLLSMKKAHQVLDVLDLSNKERELFFQTLAFDHSQKQRVSSEVKEFLKKPSAFKKVKNLEIEQFSVISDWYHYAILEMTFLENFQSKPLWISRRLNISVMEVKLAIARLLELELLEWKGEQLVKTQMQLMTKDRHLTSSAHKKRQKQILEKSLFSLENHAIESRNHTAMTMAIDPASIPEAKKRINDFMNELTTFLESGERKNVYEMTINLFSLEKEGMYEN